MDTERENDEEIGNSRDMVSEKDAKKIPWTANMTNIAVLKAANMKITLVNIQKREGAYSEQFVERRLENLTPTGKINGKGSRGQQRTKTLDDVYRWRRTANNNCVIRAIEDREHWRAMITITFR